MRIIDNQNKMKGSSKTTAAAAKKPAAQPQGGAGLMISGQTVKSQKTPVVASSALGKPAPAKAGGAGKALALATTGQKKAPAQATAPKKEDKPEQIPTQQQQQIEEKKELPTLEEAKVPPREPTPPPQEPIKFEVMVKYNHYKGMFPVLDGVLREDSIDEEYCLSFVFKGNYALQIREEKDPERKYLAKAENGDKAWVNVQEGKVYVLEVDEDAEVEAERRKNAKPIEFYKPEQPKQNARINGLTAQLKGMSIDELKEKGDKYKELIEARDLEDILYK
ncbi:hypothetical protein FGO68_gene14561 [Halteria grandinella]|uniref:Uncharacterized protein n=1 Tax=Halteria grandinella TaxID=5974 RepID=A0A8J8SZT0_HALGN|nr:hypothetical protein FGO68_gene14561 [Halteria grandinella]